MATTADPLACRTSFCSQCGTLLITENSDEIECVCCGNRVCYGDLDPRSLRMVTRSEPRNEPKWVREQAEKFGLGSDDNSSSAGGKKADKKNAKAIDKSKFSSNEQNRATVNETCPECGHGKASFYTMQLRSVDEGQTVFYECLKCANNWSQNN